MNIAVEPANLAAIGDRLIDVLATPMYYPCVLLTDPDVAKLRSTAQFLLSRFGWPELSVGGALCAPLLEVPRKRWPRLAGQVLMQQVEGLAPGPILCTDVDLIFDPLLELDPLRLLREASRQTPLIVLWPGDNKNWVLSYAVAGHPHYRTWRQTELCNRCIIRL